MEGSQQQLLKLDPFKDFYFNFPELQGWQTGELQGWQTGELQGWQTGSLLVLKN